MIAATTRVIRYFRKWDNMGTFYAADISATDAWGILSSDKDSVLIDVRTPNEWLQTGIPDLNSLGKNVVLLPWRNAPNFEVNPNFISQCEQQGYPAGTKFLFLCKAGGRSAEAAAVMTQSGYAPSYNIVGGMVGEGGWLDSKLATRENA